MRVDCYRDQAGTVRAKVDPVHPVLKSFLEEDVQESRSSCLEILAALAEIQAGGALEWRQFGNAHVLTLVPDRVTIEPLFLESTPPEELPLSDFEMAVRDWLAFISD